jgi:hypothetical protein
MKKFFLTFAVTFIIATLVLLFTMMPQWTSDDGSASEFSTERALERRQFRNNRTMLVLKITIRLLVIYKRITKVRLQTLYKKAIP